MLICLLYHVMKEEMKWLADNKVQDIAILDPTFNTNTLHAVNIFERLHECKVSVQVRPEKLNRRFLEAAAKSKAHVTLEMGVQTLNATEMALIDRVKGADPDRVIKKVKEQLLFTEEFSRDVNREISVCTRAMLCFVVCS
jgi:radical SAM superfamily enzyme